MNPQLVQEIITLIALAGEYGTELYLKLKAIGELGADEQANIHKQITDGIAFDQSVKDKYAQWRVHVGLDSVPTEPVPPASTPAPAVPPTPQTPTEAAPATLPPAVVPIAAPAPAPAPKVSTVHDSSSTIPPTEEAPKAGSD